MSQSRLYFFFERLGVASQKLLGIAAWAPLAMSKDIQHYKETEEANGNTRDRGARKGQTNG